MGERGDGRGVRVWQKCCGWNWIAAVAVFLVLAGCSAGKQAQVDDGESRTAAVEEAWGVKPLSVRLTAEDFFIDFRYKVIDPEKAKQVLRRDSKAYLLDVASGKTLPVPITKLGPLRGIDEAPHPGRVYTVLFSNVDKTIKKGSKVTVVMGDLRVEDLTVE